MNALHSNLKNGPGHKLQNRTSLKLIILILIALPPWSATAVATWTDNDPVRRNAAHDDTGRRRKTSSRINQRGLIPAIPLFNRDRIHLEHFHRRNRHLPLLQQRRKPRIHPIPKRYATTLY